MKMKYFRPKRGERSIITGRVEGIVDCEAVEVAAWFYDFNSREAIRTMEEYGRDVVRVVVDNSKPGETTVAMVKLFPFFLRNREIVLRNIFKVESNGSVIIAIESVDANVDYGASFKTLRGFSRALWRIENLPDRSQVKQCQVTLYQYFDAGGSIPMWLVNRKVPETLAIVQDAINEFRQDDKIDNAERDELVTLMMEGQEGQEYTDEELVILERGKIFFHTVRDSSDLKIIESPDPLALLKTTHLDNDSLVSGYTQTTVDASLEEAATYEYLKMSREGVRTHLEKGGIEKHIRRINDHSQFYVTSRDLIPGFGPREWRSRVIWKKDDDKIVIVYEDTKDFDNDVVRTGVLGSAQSTWVLERMPLVQDMEQTRVTFVSRVDIGMPLPKFVMNTLARKYAKALSTMRQKFDKSLEIDKVRRKSLIPQIKRMPVRGDGAPLVEAQFNDLFKGRENSEELKTGYKSASSRVKVESSGSTAWGKTR